jgi:hypothetical protein
MNSRVGWALIPPMTETGTLQVEPSDLAGRKFIRSRPRRFFGTIGFRGLDQTVNRLDRKPT